MLLRLRLLLLLLLLLEITAILYIHSEYTNFIQPNLPEIALELIQLWAKVADFIHKIRSDAIE